MLDSVEAVEEMFFFIKCNITVFFDAKSHIIAAIPGLGVILKRG